MATVKLDEPVQEIIDFAIGFTSLGKLPANRLRLKRSVSDLLHTMGYYTEQVKPAHLTPAARLLLISQAIRHISEHLGTL